MSMHIAFRVDSGLHIGSGHLMRCLALAQALAARGAQCYFLCRDFPGSAHGLVDDQGHVLGLLAPAVAPNPPAADYARWLGVTKERDRGECLEWLRNWPPMEWLVVDHYALDAVWHRPMQACAERMLVIDDLANRDYDCDLLLDQTYGREAGSYRPRLCKPDAELLLGSVYALLRPEFGALHNDVRPRRRQTAGIKKILISMGGMDAENITAKILMSLVPRLQAESIQIVVVVAANSPHYEAVKRYVEQSGPAVELLSGVTDMAGLMLQCDLAIGAAGSTTWERCCMGLPSLLLVCADNQKFLAGQLAATGAVIGIEADSPLLPEYIERLDRDAGRYQSMVTAALNICDGRGARRVSRAIAAAEIGV